MGQIDELAEVNRYLGWPGQAPSYEAGERLWMHARGDARSRHSSAFDSQAFTETP